MKADKDLRPFLMEMYYELLSQRFVAIKVPDNRKSSMEGKFIWVAESHNPKWYSDFIRKYPKKRRSVWRWKKKASKKLREADSRIVRKDIESLLKRLSCGEDVRSKYANDLIDIAKNRQITEENPLTELEEYLWQCHKIVLSDKDVNFLAKKGLLRDERCFDFIAEIVRSKQELKIFFNDDIPF